MGDPVFKFKEGDKVSVNSTTRWKKDQHMAGKIGVIDGKPWHNMDSRVNDPVLFFGGNVYNFKGEDDARYPLFEEDLTLFDELEWHRSEVARLEAQREVDKQKNIPTTLRVASSIFFPPSQLVIKVAENKWHWYHVDKTVMQCHSHSADKAVQSEIAEYLENGKSYNIHRPTDL